MGRSSPDVKKKEVLLCANIRKAVGGPVGGEGNGFRKIRK